MKSATVEPEAEAAAAAAATASESELCYDLQINAVYGILGVPRG